MSLAELDGSGDSRATDALLKVEQAVREQTLQQVRNLSLAALLVLVPVGLAIGWSRAASCGPLARSPASRARSRRPTFAADPPRRSARRDARSRRHFDAMLDRLDQGVRTQRRFVEDASHELRNPLAVIRTTSMSRSRARGPRGLRRAAEVARRTADRMSTTVDELMALARTSVQPERRTSVDLAEVVASRPGVRRRGLDPRRPAVPARSIRPGHRRGPVRAEARPGEPRLERAPSGPSGSVVHCRRTCRWMAVVRGPRRRARDRARRPGSRLPPRLARRGSDGRGRRARAGAGPRSPDRRGTRRHGQRGLGPRGTAQASSCGCRTDADAKGCVGVRAPGDGRPALDGGRGLLTGALGRAYTARTPTLSAIS